MATFQANPGSAQGAQHLNVQTSPVRLRGLGRQPTQKHSHSGGYILQLKSHIPNRELGGMHIEWTNV